LPRESCTKILKFNDLYTKVFKQGAGQSNAQVFLRNVKRCKKVQEKLEDRREVWGWFLARWAGFKNC
jgi:hypothetical protein